MSSHPMVPVPQAIMRVLTETAAMIIKRGTQTETIFISHQHHHHEQGSNPEQEQQSLLGRISAVNIRASELGYPPYNASIMDGYAIDTDDKMAHISDDHYDDCQLFHVKDRVYAGAATQSQETYVDIDMVEYTNLLPKSIYVTTGAVIPTPYNAVIPMEEVDETDVKEHRIISIPHQTLASLKRNAWIRPIGCDIKPDSIILKKGERIEPVHIGLLAQCGIDKVEVTSLPSVGILSTGNELYSQVANRDEKDSAGGDGNVDVALGTIPDANGPVLCSLLSSYGSCQPKFLGIARDDDEDALTTILRDSILEHDVIITTGGISMGEMDIIEEVLVNNLGCKIHFGRLNMKPGKPTTFLSTELAADSKMRLIFAMPGNPVSAMVCTELLIRPCLDMMHLGAIGESVKSMVNNAQIHAEVSATLRQSVQLDMSRPEYHRVKLGYVINKLGHLELVADSTGVQRSSRLMSMLDADGLMMLPQGVKGDTPRAEVGESFTVLLSRRAFGNIGTFRGMLVKDSLHLGRCIPTIGLLGIGESRADGTEMD